MDPLILVIIYSIIIIIAITINCFWICESCKYKKLNKTNLNELNEITIPLELEDLFDKMLGNKLTEEPQSPKVLA